MWKNLLAASSVNFNCLNDGICNGGEVLAWLSVWSEVQMICIWYSCGHCHPIISCSSKIQNGLPFWCRLTQVIMKKGR